MKLIDALEQVSLSFRSNKFKTLMSSLGIIIGVIAIVVMLSRCLRVWDRKLVYQKPAEFYDKDINALENTVGVKTVSPRTGSSMSVKFRDEEREVAITGLSPTEEPDLSGSIDKGRFLANKMFIVLRITIDKIITIDERKYNAVNLRLSAFICG
ncbi:hypothetical protein ig2599ANME_0865 [groundwater metagenome]